MRYTEELALWGFNALQVWFDMPHDSGIKDPDAVAMLWRLGRILRAAQDVGMAPGLCLLSNEAYRSSSPELRTDPNTKRSHYRVELCPSKPQAVELMLRWFADEFRAFADVDIQHIWIWPYDQGGCACPACAPWGGNGHLRMARRIAELARQFFPRMRVVLSTWPFDDSDGQALTRELRGRDPHFDYLLAESHGAFPRCPIEHGVSGGLPMVNFPEISMCGLSPWGGYGATPLPQRFQRIWEQSSEYVQGGWPYSEGIFEDINKVIIGRFYWDPRCRAEQAVREYAALLQEDAPRALALLRQAEKSMTAAARSSWRWRLLMLHARIDDELVRNASRVTPAVERLMRELIPIYHAEKAEWTVSPPVPESWARLIEARGPEKVGGVRRYVERL